MDYLCRTEFEFETVTDSEFETEFETEFEIFCEYQPWYLLLLSFITFAKMVVFLDAFLD